MLAFERVCEKVCLCEYNCIFLKSCEEIKSTRISYLKTIFPFHFHSYKQKRQQQGFISEQHNKH